MKEFIKHVTAITVTPMIIIGPQIIEAETFARW